jgi:putative methionine-R-sulfoxide reductase with GAF domain
MSYSDFHGSFNEIIGMLENRLGVHNAILRKLVGDELKTIAYYGYGEQEAHLKIVVGQGVTGLCAKEKKVIVINDLSRYSGQYLAGIGDAKSELCLPLLISDRLVGTFNIESTMVDNFSNDKIELIKNMSDMLAYSAANSENKTGSLLASALARLEKQSV